MKETATAVRVTMKIMPFLFFCFVFFIISWNTNADNFTLETPECIEQYKTSPNTIKKLNAILKDNQIKSFYNEAEKNELTFSITTKDNVYTELKNKIWHCYLVATAPVFTFKTYQETEPDIDIDDTADLSRKSMVCGFLEKYIGLIRDSGEIKEPLKKTIIRRLLLPYYAHILKQFKNAHEHNPYSITETKEQGEHKQEKTIYVTSRKQLEEIFTRMNEIADGKSFINARNIIVKDEVNYLEKVFMELLVAEFPGTYAKVEDFLLKAGYSREDIPGLIDRTVGRDAKTDFLYQGRHRIEHDRLFKKKRKK